MNQPLRVLMVEDSEDDATLLLLALRRGGYEVVHAVVDTPAAMRAALKRQEWDVITSDHSMPQFSAPAALALAKEFRPNVPFIIVSGEIDLSLAVSLMKEGARDYIQKRELPRVVSAIESELREAEIRRERQQVKDALESSETRYRRLFETAQDGILILDADTGQIQDVNPFLMEMLGYSKGDLLGKKLWEIGAFRDTKASKNAFAELQSKGYVRYEDLPLESRAGEPKFVEFVSNVYRVDNTKVAQCNIRDITTRKETERELVRLATTDPLTGIANRRQFLEQLKSELLRIQRFGGPATFLMFDLDHFKRVNDTFGHTVGDAVLRHFAGLAKNRLRGIDFFGRLGGEEFGVVLPGTDLVGAAEFAERFRRHVAESPAPSDNGPISFTVSVGAADLDAQDSGPSSVLARADAALYRAKEGGRNRVEAARRVSALPHGRQRLYPEADRALRQGASD